VPFSAGSASGAASGSVDALPPSRCGFAPELGSAAAPTASADAILNRVVRFLDESSPPGGVQPPGVFFLPPPSQDLANWAGTLATAILDQHFVNGTEAPGLVRFLTAWLNIPTPDAGLSAAHTWSIRLLDPSATLTTLLAGPTGEPHRIGILTDPQVLTALPSISNRGRWMSQKLLCSAIPDPPPGVNLAPPIPMPGLTRREQLQSLTRVAPCSSCHQLMDPPGFSLEHFDAMGNYRDLDNGKPVDSSGTLVNPPMLTFASFDDLAPNLGVSCAVAQCFAKLVMSDAYGVSLASITAEEANHVANAFANSDFSIRELVRAIVGTPSFLQ